MKKKKKKKRNDVHIVWRARRFFFIHTSRKRIKKSTVNSYNLISYHFHTKSKGKQP